MATDKEILFFEFESIRKDLIALYDAKGMRSTGAWAAALEVQVTEDKAILYGLEYSQQLETGRQKGRFPPLENIKQWILDKGVFTQAIQEIGLSSLAFLIARKIAREGWKRDQHGGVNLITDVVTEERIQKIIDQVGASIVVRYTDDLVKLLKAA